MRAAQPSVVAICAASVTDAIIGTPREQRFGADASASPRIDPSGAMLTSGAMPETIMGPSRQRFLDAAFGRPTDVPPVWLMRQAGRYLPEYREVRKRLKFLELCADVPAAIEVTLQPFRRFGMDGIVFFSDILIPLPPMGIEVQLDEGGPQLPSPVRTAQDVARLHDFDPTVDTAFVTEIHRGLKRIVHDTAATIGFCGAPWTLATYAIEGLSLIHI